MSLASLSRVTFFTAVQVGFSSRQFSFRYVRFVSLVMLTVVTSGHCFTLLLSFSIWTKTLPVVRSGRPEAHEVILRSISMVALLLQLRLLQLVWRSRTRADDSITQIGGTGSAPSKVSDFSVWGACLPIYGTLIVVVAYVHRQLGPHQEEAYYMQHGRIWAFVLAHRRTFSRVPIYFRLSPVIADLRACSGVILDLFLLPQVIANVLWDTEEKVSPLYPLFYVGMTGVRSVAHLFDAVRAWNFVPELRFSNYNYANPNWGLYSTTWNILIPCASVFLAVVLRLQQRYGGRCLIPKRLLPRSKYQLVEL